MKRCIETHTVLSFGEIPEGSLWDDDSPYLEDDSKFENAGGVVPAGDAALFGESVPPLVLPPRAGRAAKPKES